MTDERPRIGQPAMERFVKDEIARLFRSPKRFYEETGFDKTTYYRVIGDSPSISAVSYRALEGALDLPRNVLDYIASGDLDRLRKAGLDADQLRVAEEYLEDVTRTDTQAATAQDVSDVESMIVAEGYGLGDDGPESQQDRKTG